MVEEKGEVDSLAVLRIKSIEASYKNEPGENEGHEDHGSWVQTMVRAEIFPRCSRHSKSKVAGLPGNLPETAT